MIAPYLHTLDQPDGWLTKDALRGWHCRFCFGKLVKPDDKFSITGYGHEGDNELRILVPIPKAHKLTNHSVHPRHELNLNTFKQLASGTSLQPDATVYFTITPEDEIYARTIRTVHILVVRQLPLHDMSALLELQQANGAVISYDHASRTTTSDMEDGSSGGGLPDWLEAGVRVFKKMQRERVQCTIMVALFPKGVPIGMLGDGSTDRSMYEQEAVVTRHMGANGKPFNLFHDLAELDLTQSADGRSPDAKCITECYSGSLDQLNKHEGYLFISDWRRALVGTSFDGASVYSTSTEE